MFPFSLPLPSELSCLSSGEMEGEVTESESLAVSKLHCIVLLQYKKERWVGEESTD